MGVADWIPGVHSLKNFAEGDYIAGIGNLGADVLTGGLWSPVSGLAKKGYNAYTGAQDELRKGYQQTVADSRAEAERQRQFQMQGLAQAENYYRPAQAMVEAAYGSPANLRK